MDKKIILKILGMVGGLIIIFSLFIPFIKDAGSLWNIYMNNGQIYLIFVIMVFGLLPTVLYGINKKTEYSYMSVGALLFFELLQLANTVSANSIKSLSIGFYIMFIGIIMIAVATFILNKDLKVKILDEQIAPISNNISNPLNRNGLEVSIDENNPENVNANDDENKSLGDEDSNNEIEMLGEEIPDYEPENGINPVLAEFTSEENNTSQSTLPDDNITENNPVETSAVLDVSPVQSEATTLSDQPETLNTQSEIALQPEIPATQPEIISEQPEISATQPEIISEQPEISATQSEMESVQPEASTTQPEIAFDEPQENEIPEEPEPQLDIFGQPK